jgi:Uma2 family endonuclease
MLDPYRQTHPGVIHRVYGGAECKLLIEGTESERHPDLAIYKTSAPSSDSSVWSLWVPEIVIEVVSEDSVQRDYEEKPEDYLQFGVLEYWIVDPLKNAVTINRRVRGRWKSEVLVPGKKYATPRLPGFELDVARILSP